MAKRTVLTFARLRDILDYNPETGKFTKRPKEVGIHHARGGCRLWVGNEQHLAHRVAWFWMTGQWPPVEFVIDHINGDSTDNRWSNLRLATPSQNQRNRTKPSKNAPHGLSGAYKYHRNGRWFSKLGKKHLGYFDTKEEAHKAYCEAVVSEFGDFAPDRLKRR